MASTRTPAAVARAQTSLGSDLATWRKLRQLTVAQVADRAGVGQSTVTRLENGRGASLENVLRVARALGVLDQLVASVNPYASPAGMLRADEALPRRVRPPKEIG